MGQVIIGRNTRVEVEKTDGADVTISAISKANPAVVTYTGTTTLVDGDIIVISDDTEGMQEVAGQIARVDNVDHGANTFELEGLNSTGFGTLSGTTTFYVISAWSTLAKARTVNATSPTPNKLDSTVLLDTEDQAVFSGNPAADISFEGLSDMLSEATGIIETAARANDPLGFRLTLSNGQKRYFRCYVTLPGESLPRGDLATSTFNGAQIRRRLAFAS